MARGDLLHERRAEVRDEAGGLLWRGVCDWAARAQKDRLGRLLGENENNNVVHQLRGELRILAIIPNLADKVIEELETAAKQGGGS